MIPLKDDNPLRRTPWVTILLIVANVLAFFWQLSQPDDLGLDDFALVPRALAGALGLDPGVPRDPALLQSREIIQFYRSYDPPVPVLFTILTSMFMHGGWGHLIGNMWSLWIFGNNVEDETGPVAFVVFYVLCGVAAALTQTFIDVSSPVPMVGASGAIAGVLGAYLLRFPHARVLTIVPIFLAWVVWVPAGVWIAIWFITQILSSGLGGQVAWYAHIGGFIAGMVLGPVFMGARRRRVPAYERIRL
jgi:membrane associated rhomboid family serine protease